MIMPSSNNLTSGHWIRLSHVLSSKTPAYGGGASLGLGLVRFMSRGDSCNTVTLSFSNHLGSHVDAPLHFIADGKSVDSYAIGDWIFNKPCVIDIQAEKGEVLDIPRFETALNKCGDADILLVRTGFEKVREQKEYWSSSPAFAPELAAYLTTRLPSLVALGMDCISISSYQHRELGKKAHQSFLGAGLRIFEDLALASIQAEDKLQMVIALPLLFENADGSPCTVIASTGSVGHAPQ